MKLSKFDSDRSNYTVCPIDPVSKIGAFYPEANFLKLNPPINHKNIQFTNPSSILPNLTGLCPISVQTFSVITLNDPKMEN